MPLGFNGRQLVVRIHQLPIANAPADTHIETKFRHVGSLDHDELCRVFSFGNGSNRSMTRGSGTGTVDGYVLFNGEPIARLHVAYEGEKFPDVDPRELVR
jgi:hypothetical protein